MKKLKWLALLLCVLALTVFTLASCGGSGSNSTTKSTEPVTEPATEPATDAPEYEITFSVNGVETKVTVAEGSIPAFEGQTDWEDSDFHYSISGWDKEIVAANGNATYVATIAKGEIVDVIWITKDDVKTTKSYIGGIPTPPTISETYTTDAAIYTFTGEWTPAFSPLTKDRTSYEAKYSSEARNYTITFVANDQTVSTATLAYGETPTAPTVAIPSGYTDVSWGGISSVTGDATYNARFCTMDPAVFEIAVSVINKGGMTDRSSGALLIALEEKAHPGFYSDLVLSFLRWIIAGGNEPEFEFSPNFNHPMISAAIAVAKATPSVWDQLTSAEVARLDLLMKCMAVQGAQATDDQCNYFSGPGFNGNYKKTWNPNYPLSNVTQMIFCTSYFGGAAQTNQILKDFDYDAYIALFKEYGWTNVLSMWTREPNNDGTISYKTATEGSLKETWTATVVTDDGNGHLTLKIKTSSEDIAAQTYGNLSTGFVEGQERIINYTTPKAMMMNGGEVYAMKALYRISQYVGKSCGTGIGVPAIGEKGYTYKGHGLDDLAGIWNSLVDYNYSGGIVTSKAVLDATTGQYRCYIYDGTTSPVEGYEGMMKEFNSGSRSSVGYCRGDYIMCAATTSAMTSLNLYNPLAKDNIARAKKVWVGNVDFLYKAEHGYVSYSGTAVRGDPKPEYGSSNAYKLWAYYWETNEKGTFTLEDISAPIITADVVENVSLNTAGESGSNDFTITPGKKANEVLAKDKHYWETDYYLSFSLNYDDEMLNSVEIRLRSGAYTSDSSFRGAFLRIDSGEIVSIGGYAKSGYPTSVALGEYGWHRITVGVHQDTIADDNTKSVSYKFTVTVYVDGVEGTVFEYDGSTFVSKGWALYGAKYDETVEGHIVYSDYTPYPGRDSSKYTWTETTKNNPYFQIYHGKVFNNESLSWFFECGDQVAYSGNAPEAGIVPVTYSLNGGAFHVRTISAGSAGYNRTYTAVDVTWFASTRLVTFTSPEKPDNGFYGWFNNEELTGDALSGIQSTESLQPVHFYAKWGDPITENPIDNPED